MLALLLLVPGFVDIVGQCSAQLEGSRTALAAHVLNSLQSCSLHCFLLNRECLHVRIQVVEDDGCELERGFQVLLLAVDVLAPASGNTREVAVGQSERHFGVYGPAEQPALVGDYGVEVVGEFEVVHGQQVLDFDGQEVQVVGQVRDVAQAARVH